VILPLATLRGTLAQYVNTLAYVYVIVIILYVLSNLAFTAGLRIPYSRWSDAILAFLRDLTLPLLRLCRKLVPMFGGIDLSPIVAVIIVRLAGHFAAQAISG
jgi:YggT family protein